MANPLKKLMPSMWDHEGIWEGNYQHLDLDGNIIDQHKSRVQCIFPDDGFPDNPNVVYRQHNHFEWANGQTYDMQFDGILIDEKIYWDTATFQGYGWSVANNMVVLDLQRKDEPGASFQEIIVIGNDKNQRARTWHWFKQGKCFKRTLCNEWLIQS